MNFRRAEMSDKERILEICSTVWDGEDYMPNVIDNWLHDQIGEFTVMEEDGRVMGLGKMTIVAPKIGWLEGLRVAPEARSKGFAKQITRYYIERGLKLGLEKLQLSTYYDNHPSIHVTTSNGFQKVAEFWYGEQDVNPEKEASANVIQATMDSTNCAELIDMLLNAPEQKTQRDFLGYGWLFKEMTEEIILAEIKAGHVFYLNAGQEICASMLIYPDRIKDKLLYIPIITGTDQGITSLLNWAHKTAQGMEFGRISSMVPEDQHLKSLYMTNGFVHWGNMQEANVYIYEYDLLKGDCR